MTSASAAPAGRLPFPRLLAFSAGSVPGYLLLGIMGVYLPRFYAGHLGISLLTLGATIAVIRLADLFIDLGLGMMMDAGKTALGRYRPWFLLAIPVTIVAVYKVFNPPADAGIPYMLIWYSLLYVAYSLLVLSHSAWAGTLSGDGT